MPRCDESLLRHVGEHRACTRHGVSPHPAVVQVDQPARHALHHNTAAAVPAQAALRPGAMLRYVATDGASKVAARHVLQPAVIKRNVSQVKAPASKCYDVFAVMVWPQPLQCAWMQKVSFERIFACALVHEAIPSLRCNDHNDRRRCRSECDSRLNDKQALLG